MIFIVVPSTSLVCLAVLVKIKLSQRSGLWAAQDYSFCSHLCKKALSAMATVGKDLQARLFGRLLTDCGQPQIDSSPGIKRKSVIKCVFSCFLNNLLRVFKVSIFQLRHSPFLLGLF